MMKLAHVVQLIVFVTTLTLEVRVHADDAATILSLPRDTALTEIPDHCLLESQRCAIKTSARGKFKFPVGRAEIVMSNNTSVVKSPNPAAGTSAEEQLTFMSGALWIRTPEPLTIDTEFGEIHSVGQERAEFWIVHRDGKVWAQALENAVFVRPRGGQFDIKLEAGEELWIGGVQADGIAANGIARPIEFGDFAHQWALVYPGDGKEFKADLAKVDVQIKEAAAQIASVQGGLVQRQIASEKQAIAQQEKAKQQLDAHDQKYRELFRRKVLGD